MWSLGAEEVRAPSCASVAATSNARSLLNSASYLITWCVQVKSEERAPKDFVFTADYPMTSYQPKQIPDSVANALMVLEDALDPVRESDMGTPEVIDAVKLLLRHADERWPFVNSGRRLGTQDHKRGAGK